MHAATDSKCLLILTAHIINNHFSGSVHLFLFLFTPLHPPLGMLQLCSGALPSRVWWGVSDWKERNLLALLFEECSACSKMPTCLSVSRCPFQHGCAFLHSLTCHLGQNLVPLEYIYHSHARLRLGMNPVLFTDPGQASFTQGLLSLNDDLVSAQHKLV